MLKEAYGIKRLVIRTGKTDLRYGIDRLCSIVRTEYGFNPREEGVLYIFCGTRNDRLKALVFEGDGFVLLTKRLLKGMEFKWPRSQTQALEIPAETYMELMNGCEVESSIPYSEIGPEPETERNIDASLGDIGLVGAEEDGPGLGENAPLSVSEEFQDNKNTGLSGVDGPGRVTQERAPLDDPILEGAEEDPEGAGGKDADEAARERQKSPSNAERASPRVA